jgi:hypothetical protein
MSLENFLDDCFPHKSLLSRIFFILNPR